MLCQRHFLSHLYLPAIILLFIVSLAHSFTLYSISHINVILALLYDTKYINGVRNKFNLFIFIFLILNLSVILYSMNFSITSLCTLSFVIYVKVNICTCNCSYIVTVVIKCQLLAYFSPMLMISFYIDISEFIDV